MDRPTSVTISIFERPDMARKRGQKTGHLKRKSGSWLLRYWVDSATEIDQKTRRPKRIRLTQKIGTYIGPEAIKKREAARIAWEEILSPLDAAHIRPSSARTFLEFVNVRYRPDVLQTLKPTTQHFAESILRCHVLPVLGSKPLRDILPAHVQDLLNTKRRQGLSTQTLLHIKNRISAVLRHAKSHRWYFGELPTEAARLPQMQREPRLALTWDQVALIANALPEPVSTLVVMLALTGLRIGEAMGLRWRHLNLTESPMLVSGEVIPPMSLLVRENYIASLKKKVERRQTLKTGSSYRTAMIPDWFAPRLLRLAVGSKFVGIEDPVFCARNGRPLDSHNIAARVMKPVVVALGFPWVSFHVFRHTFATLIHERLTMDERMRMMGHASSKTTMHYTHPEHESTRAKLAGMVNPKMLN